MIPGGGDPPRPKVQILEILDFRQNNRYFSRLRRSTKPNHINNTMFYYFAPQGDENFEIEWLYREFLRFTLFSMRSVLICLCFTMESLGTYVISLSYLSSREGGPPRTQSSNLRLLQIKIYLQHFVFR